MAKIKLTYFDVPSSRGEECRLALHLAGLEELIPGALWSGAETQVLEAIRTAHESGVSIKAKEDPQGGTWHVELEGRKLEIEVRSDGKPPAKLTPAELDYNRRVKR